MRHGFVAFVATLALLISGFASGAAADYSSPIQDGDIDTITYEVTHYNETTVTLWWDPVPENCVYWAVEVGSTATLEIGNVNGDEVEVEFIIGNLSKGFQNDTVYASALAMGYWAVPNGGFVIDLGLDDLKTAYEDQNFVEFTWTETSRWFGSIMFDTVLIELVDAYGQETMLQYDTASGVLLQALTGFGNYELGINATSFTGNSFQGLTTTASSTNEDSDSDQLSFEILITFLGGMFLLVVRRKKDCNSI